MQNSKVRLLHMHPFLFALLLALVLSASMSLSCQSVNSRSADAPNNEASVEEFSRLELVKSLGKVRCATQTDLPGFGYIDSDGDVNGFDVDLCRAVAAAIFGDPEAVDIKHVAYAEREELLRAGDADVLARTTTWKAGREARWGSFTITMFYDGQGFMVPKSLGIASAFDLDGASVCVPEGTGTQQNLADFFRQNGFTLETVTHKETSDTYEAYERGECLAATIDKSQLAAARSAFDAPDAHIILPETISKEPLAPMVPRGDEQWTVLVRTVMYVLINAEELGVTQSNVEAMRNGSDNIRIKRMLGVEGSFGQQELGLEPDFAVDVIKAVGNYGEIYDRYMGPESAVPFERGLNNLWTNGGLIYAPPLR